MQSQHYLPQVYLRQCCVGQRPDLCVYEGDVLVAVIEAKDRRRVDKPEVVGAIAKYQPGPERQLLIYVPDGCAVSRPAQDQPTARLQRQPA